MSRAEHERDTRGAWIWIAVGCGGLALSALCIVPPFLWLVLEDDAITEAPPTPAPIPVAPAPDPTLPPPPAIADPSPRRITALVEQASGVGVAVGSTCSFDVAREDRPDGTFWCNAQITCGGQLLYGGANAGYFDCTLYDQPERHVVGEDPNTTSGDGDAAMRLDTLRSELTVRDDASGRLGAFSLRARVTSVQ